MTTPKPQREWWILRWSEDWLMNTLEEAADCDIASYGWLIVTAAACRNSSMGVGPHDCISLDKANRLLNERGRIVYVKKYSDNGFWGGMEQQQEDDTHTALLINIDPIEQDSAEGLLSEIISSSRVLGFDSGFKMDKWLERARALLAKEGE